MLLRVEAGPILPNLFSSQQRCIVPTKLFTAKTGYGCFSYIPLIWTEQSKVLTTQKYYRYYDHYYSRPDRAALLMNIGLALGSFFILAALFLFISESYRRKRFKSRVYVD